VTAASDTSFIPSGTTKNSSPPAFSPDSEITDAQALLRTPGGGSARHLKSCLNDCGECLVISEHLR
jgi:hypothetical protein